MKVAHWLHVAGVSGLKASALSFFIKERDLGFETGICSPDEKYREGGERLDLGRAGSTVLKPWSWAMAEDAVNLFHQDLPSVVGKLRNRVFPAHGNPLYCYYSHYLENDDALGFSLHIAELCDLTLVWNRMHIQYWSEFIPKEKIRFVRSGVDLDLWNPEGQKSEFRRHPTLLYADAVRTGSIPLKNPFNTLIALKKVAREIPTTRLQLLNVPPKKQVFWAWLVGRLHVESIVENFLVGVASNMDRIYRGVDILVHPIQGGSISSVGCEALACGLPTIILEGEEDTHASMKCRNDPDSIAEAILSLWDRIQRDPEGERIRARRIAEEHYDSTRTVHQMHDLYADFFGLEDSILSEVQRMDVYWSETPKSFGYEPDRMKVMAALCRGFTLDLGCGKGPYTHLLKNVIGIDISREALREYDRDKVQGSVEHLPFKDAVFDGILGSEILEHVEDDQTVKEAFRVLKPGGMFVLSVPNGLRKEWHLPSWQSPTHRRLYTPEALRELLGESLEFHSYEDAPLNELRLVASVKK